MHIPMNVALQLHYYWSLSNSKASPRIWTGVAIPSPLVSEVWAETT